MTETTSQDLLARLADIIESRKPAHGGDPDKSYIARLFSKGTDAILKKIGEEATETVIAALSGSREELVGEAADLLFHLLILLAAKEVSLADVLAELERREGVSGIVEKAARKPD